MDNQKRFVNFHDGRGVVDTQIHPKVLAAQEEYARKGKKKVSAPKPGDLRRSG